MRVEICAVSDIGRKRNNNEDVCLVNGWSSAENDGVCYSVKENTSRPVLIGVFDGMGGIEAGEVAAGITALSAMANFSAIGSFESDVRMLESVVLDANEKVCGEMMKRRVRMGTTASMICFRKNDFSVCNIGDSPMFLLRNGDLKEIYVPHNERAEYEAKFGKCDEHKKFRLTQHIGIFKTEKQIEPYTLSGKLRRGDRFLICSDGLTDMITVKDVERILNEADNVRDAVSILLDAALENGGKDNISVIAAEVKKNRFFLGW